MKIKCPKCGNEFKIFRIDHDNINPDGFSTICPECVGSFDIDERIITEKMFITDVAKMADYLSLSKKSFLKSYSYLTEDEYDATDLYYDWLIRG